MKKVSFFMIAVMLAASAVFVSCDKEEKDPPTITVSLNGTDQNSITVEGDETVAVKIDFNAQAGIKQIDLEIINGNNVAGFPKTSGFTSSNFDQVSFTVPMMPDGGKVEYSAKVTDKDNNSANRTFTINFTKVLPTFGEINTWPATGDLVLGSLAHTSTEHSSCASIDGTKYAVVGITAANQAKVDFIYFDGNAANNRDKSLAAPTNASVGTLSGVSGWTTKNATKLGLLAGVTTAHFDDCDDDELIEEKVTATAVNADIVSKLEVGNIVGFITGSGKKGLIKVVGIDQSSAASNSIKIIIKVQK